MGCLEMRCRDTEACSKARLGRQAGDIADRPVVSNRGLGCKLRCGTGSSMQLSGDPTKPNMEQRRPGAADGFMARRLHADARESPVRKATQNGGGPLTRTV